MKKALLIFILGLVMLSSMGFKLSSGVQGKETKKEEEKKEEHKVKKHKDKHDHKHKHVSKWYREIVFHYANELS